MRQGRRVACGRRRAGSVVQGMKFRKKVFVTRANSETAPRSGSMVSGVPQSGAVAVVRSVKAQCPQGKSSEDLPPPPRQRCVEETRC